ncbi:hypothetical protein E2C01_060853 [Portunus trituberculatus]|uniref:Uncharacterized protein n=1 Tax=Portunus trituberculatus TaxID=210409 RepID=A0A5B7H2B4_PORTR|nr:hypothetical protein [Portunus trituberculatus]
MGDALTGRTWWWEERRRVERREWKGNEEVNAGMRRKDMAYNRAKMEVLEEWQGVVMGGKGVCMYKKEDEMDECNKRNTVEERSRNKER